MLWCPIAISIVSARAGVASATLTAARANRRSSITIPPGCRVRLDPRLCSAQAMCQPGQERGTQVLRSCGIENFEYAARPRDHSVCRIGQVCSKLEQPSSFRGAPPRIKSGPGAPGMTIFVKSRLPSADAADRPAQVLAHIGIGVVQMI